MSEFIEVLLEDPVVEIQRRGDRWKSPTEESELELNTSCKNRLALQSLFVENLGDESGPWPD
jgi:hypothetical protein